MNNRVSGYASTFEPYVLCEGPGYTIYEQISRHAFDAADMDDVVLLFDHAGDVLARTTNGTLKLNVDNSGLHVDARLDGTQSARNRFEEIENKYLTQMSFSFVVDTDKREVISEEGDHVTILRTITGFKKIMDVSVVTWPANPKTNIGVRSLSAAEKEDLKKRIRILSQM